MAPRQEVNPEEIVEGPRRRAAPKEPIPTTVTNQKRVRSQSQTTEASVVDVDAKTDDEDQPRHKKKKIDPTVVLDSDEKSPPSAVTVVEASSVDELIGMDS